MMEKKFVGVTRKKLGCTLILLLLLMMMMSSSEPKKITVEAARVVVEGESGKHYRLRSPPLPGESPYNKFKGGGGGGMGFQDNGDPEQVLGDGKRRVVTGPNPLHNR
ncbi:hypothetical protein MLD38_025975 [Melastoma candidum]|uniref:Uncharacterized protein n=1 Tax=Melastoma candidum TaxID=119954 RepID=A0ACB9NYP2_9MYRT|nr:hypothetical protein MLD38_025975 [Melastoma candidum]